MQLTIRDGDLLDQPVEVIVNAWNRNFIPWRLLLPRGVSGAIKRRGGYFYKTCSPTGLSSGLMHWIWDDAT